jgi:pantoate--beta-alanine ligase
LYEADSLDYLTLVDPRTFSPFDEFDRGPARLIGALRVGSTRLLDNAAVHVG